MANKPTTGLPWLRRLLSGKPHYAIGGENPYMLRWYLIPRNRWFNVYLHRFLRSDDDRAMHDHPWWSLSIILRGGYYEVTERGVQWRRPGSVVFRRATARHRILLRNDQPTVFPTDRPVWTLFITGRKVRDWGFWCKRDGQPDRFVPWQEITDPVDSGAVGRGCGDG